jgi:methionyl aminopeptidase
LAEGDIVNIDITIYSEGVHGDTSCTFLVGDVDEQSQLLVVETRVALYKAMQAIGPGSPVNAIGRAIENHAEKFGLGVVREFIGHGVGTDFHSGLQIPHFYDRRANRSLDVGMSFTIEPMLTLGSPDMYMWDDDWTALTLDGRRTAQFEHTLIMSDSGVETTTVTASGECAHDMYL